MPMHNIAARPRITSDLERREKIVIIFSAVNLFIPVLSLLCMSNLLDLSFVLGFWVILNDLLIYCCNSFITLSLSNSIIVLSVLVLNLNFICTWNNFFMKYFMSTLYIFNNLFSLAFNLFKYYQILPRPYFLQWRIFMTLFKEIQIDQIKWSLNIDIYLLHFNWWIKEFSRNTSF